MNEYRIKIFKEGKEVKELNVILDIAANIKNSIIVTSSEETYLSICVKSKEKTYLNLLTELQETKTIKELKEFYKNIDYYNLCNSESEQLKVSTKELIGEHCLKDEFVLTKEHKNVLLVIYDTLKGTTKCNNIKIELLSDLMKRGYISTFKKSNEINCITYLTYKLTNKGYNSIKDYNGDKNWR